MKRLGMRRGMLAITLAVTSAFVLSACAPLAPLTSLFEQQSRPSAGFDTANAYYSQEVKWRGCAEEILCATVLAPQDWQSVDADEPVTLKLTKHEAAGSTRLGSVFVNPGGPGASGADFVADSVDRAASKRVQESYDVIGWDPRGVSASSPVTCYDAAGMDEYIFGIPKSKPRTAAWIEELRAGAKAFGEACAEKTGATLAYVDTVNTAHDLDMLRALVNDKKLNYIGYSYGTLIGSTYAELFPKNVGRVVLDGVVAPNVTTFDMVLFQTKGFEAALDAYLRWCPTSGDCPFPRSVDDAKDSISKLLAKVETTPLQGADGRMLGVSSLLTAIIFPLYTEEYWPYLNTLFEDLKTGETETAFILADSYFSRESNGTYSDNSNEAFAAINCLGYKRVTDYDTIKANAKAIEEAAPIFGKYQGYGELSCIDWPAETKLLDREITAKGSDPILVIGTTGDPATPYQWAVDLAVTLDNAAMVTYNGEGHTAYNRDPANQCVLDVVDDYLIDGTVPSADPQC